MNIYIVGPLFTEADGKQRHYEGECISKVLNDKGIDFELFNPIDMPLNSKADVTSKEIAMADVERLNKSDVVFFDLSTEDSGSCVALGLIMEKKMSGKDIKIYPVIHDLRLSRNSLSGLESSCGYNSMVIGIIKGNDIVIYDSFDNAFSAFKKDFDLA